MFSSILIGALLLQTTWSKPLHPQNDLAPHILIVTPQAQVHLDPALKYDLPAPFLHHLSPFARIGRPHDETIIYVPVGQEVPPSVIPLKAITLTANQLQQASSSKLNAEQSKQFPTDIGQAISQLPSQGSMFGQIINQGVASIAASAAAAGASFFPPPSQPSTSKDELLKEDEIDPANYKQGYTATDGRRLYAVAPALPHIVPVDFIHSPLFVSTGPVIRARSIQIPEQQIQEKSAALLELPEPEKLEQKDALIEKPIGEYAPESDAQKKVDFGKFIEANALKEEKKEQPLKDNYKQDKLKAQQESEHSTSNIIAEDQAQADFAQAQGKSVVVVEQNAVPVVVNEQLVPDQVTKVV